MKIKIIKDGPYIVSGNIPLNEKVILHKGYSYKLVDGNPLPQSETYTLCRCGKSKNAPFCDGTHTEIGFKGDETASRETYRERAKVLEGENMDLLDDGRCAFARFCHTYSSDVWELAETAETEAQMDFVGRLAAKCPTGRLVALTKSGEEIEPKLEPEISIFQDPEQNVSAGIYVAGGIPIESEDGELYEIRNRVMLCRCGKSKNKPFCDSAHVKEQYKDKE